MKRFLARAALDAYPLAFRRRYGDEMQALLAQEPPRLRTTLDLLRGALVAHLRPVAALEDDPAARLRGSASGVLLCWVLFAAGGFGFYKTTEDAPFAAAGHMHPVLAIAHVAVQSGAVLASAALLLGAFPLMLLAAAQGYRHRTLRRLVLRPLLPVIAFGALTAIAIAIAHRLPAHEAASNAGGGVAVVWGVAALLCGAGCVTGCRASLFAITVPAVCLRFALRCGALATAGMLMIGVAAAVYAIALATDAPSLASAGNGPLQLLSVDASIVLEVGLMATMTALAVVATRRGWRVRSSA